jgi:galactonate dehydratase
MKISRVECFPLKITPKQAYLGQRQGHDSDYYYRPEYRCVYSRKNGDLPGQNHHRRWLRRLGANMAPVVPQVIAELITQLLPAAAEGQSPLKRSAECPYVRRNARSRPYHWLPHRRPCGR